MGIPLYDATSGGHQHMSNPPDLSVAVRTLTAGGFLREHSVILTSHRWPSYNQQESVTSSCHTRSHPWERLRLSRSRRSVQANNGAPCATSSTSALTNGSIHSRRRGTSRRQCYRR